jgi:hypothetical protein
MFINFANKSLILTIVATAFLFALSFNELNLWHIKRVNAANIKLNTASTVEGYTIWSIDNSWYLPQIKNILDGHGYTLDPQNPEFKVRRTPIYPLFFGLHYVLFSEPNCFFFIRYTQLVIHLIAVLLVGQAVFNLTSNRFWATLSAILYALNPFTVTYIYTTITEAVSPALVIFILFAFSLCFKSANFKNYFFLGAVIGMSLLVRPLLLVALPAVALAVLIPQIFLHRRFRAAFGNLSMVLIGTGAILAPWAIRNYNVTNGELILLEKYYYDDPMSFGKGHSAFRDWISCWENPANTSAEVYADRIKTNLQENKEVEVVTNNFLEKVPRFVYSINSKESVAAALKSLNDCFKEKQEALLVKPNISQKEMNFNFSCESRVERVFGDLINEFKAKSPFNYYVYTPFIILKSNVFQSNTYMTAMLNPINGGALNTLQVVVKSATYLINLALFFSLIFLATGAKKSYLEIRIFVAVFVLSTFWICIVYFRYMEARYYVPCIPLLYVSLAFILSKAFALRSQTLKSV